VSQSDQTDFSASAIPSQVSLNENPLPEISEQHDPHDPYKALRYRDFRLFFLSVFLSAIGMQMVSVAIGWELYNRTNSALALGLVGLVQVLPVIILSLPAGYIADRANRKYVMLAAESLAVISAAGLAVLSLISGPLILFYACLFLSGISASFSAPVSSALLSQTIPESAYESAATWQSSSWQLASVAGPALGGLLIALFHRAAPVYFLDAVAVLIVIVSIALIQGKQPASQLRKGATLRSLLEGLDFLRQTQVMLAAITLDLFAVLLGGATTLMPIYARDILHVGPIGLGWLQAAPSIGAITMAFGLAHMPPFKKAGRILLLAVAGFGVATSIFGISHFFWLSLPMLVVLGALDNISVVMRGTLILTRTPEAMRGRVASVTSLFVAMSNQLGGFESGLAAQLLGPIVAVTAGGVGTVLVVLAVAAIWPEMRRLGTLSQHKQEATSLET
jgi:MFS family permease